MQDNLERLIKAVYRKWRSGRAQPGGGHPDEESLACFLENRLPLEEQERIKAHLINCDSCSQAVAVGLGLGPLQDKDVPAEVLLRLRDLGKAEDKSFCLEISLKLKEKFLEVLSTTGDVLVGQEFVPAPVLRSREIKDFKDEVVILKDFADIRVEAKIENKSGRAFNLSITARHRTSQRLVKDLRVTLFKDDLELESYISISGSVVFEQVLLGKYKVQISSPEERLASIVLDIKV